MDFFDTIYRRRSIRTYTGEAPTDVQVDEILKAGRAAPIGNGRYEDMHLTVIRDPKIIEAIETYDSELAGFEKHPFFGAPVVIVVSLKPQGEAPLNVEYSSAAIVAHNMSLAATAMDLGTCLVWGVIGRVAKNEEIVASFELPDGFVPTCSISLGVTDEVFSPREVPDDKISTNLLQP